MRRLGIRGLAPAEAGLVRAFMQLLAGEDDAFAWRLVADAPFDALLVDAADAGAARADHPSTPFCTVGAAPVAGSAWHMTRPLQRGVLAAWLERVGETAPAPLSAAAAAAAEREEPLAVQPVPPALAGAPAPRHRLKRWPPAALLRSEPARVRMATLLGKRALTLDELVRASGQTPAQCQMFLQLLQGFSLLDTSLPQATAPVVRAAPVAARGDGPSPMLRMVRSLRLRLGLPQ